MPPRLRIRKSALCCALTAILSGLGPANLACADDSVPPASTPADDAHAAAMRRFTSDFATKLGGSLGEANLYLSGAGKLELAEHRAGTSLPDDEPLILHPLIGKDQVNGPQDIYSTKHNHKLFMSLGDFAAATGAALTVKPAAGTATGWIYRESNAVSIDVKAGQAVIGGKTFPIAPNDVQLPGNDLLISTDALETIFGLTFDYDFSNLAVTITSPLPLPVEAAYLRSQRFSNRYDTTNKAALPYQETPYALATEPYFDVDLGGEIDHSPGQAPTKSGSFTTIMSGDIAGFNAQAYLSGNDQRPYIDDARITLGKQDVDGGLLGPLHATEYEFGDINAVSQQVIGGGGLEQGIHVTNAPLNNLTSQTYKNIRGNAQAGWDVELYRNNAYIDIRHVDASGLYDFGNVDLVAGDNDFKLIFYGPNGETHEEHQHVGVNAQTLAANKNVYDVSVSRTGEQTWQQQRSTAPGVGSLHSAARYERGLGFATVDAGVNQENVGGVTKTLGEIGGATFIYNTFLNADFGYDSSNSSYGSTWTARHNFGNQALFLQYAYDSPGFNPGVAGNTSSTTTGVVSTTSSSPSVAPFKDSTRVNLSGPLADKVLFLENLNYIAGGTYSRLYNGNDELTANTSLSGRYDKIAYSAGLNYSRGGANGASLFDGAATSVPAPPSTTTPTTTTPTVTPTSSGSNTSSILDANLTAHGFAYGGTWRTESYYELKPEFGLAETDLEYDHTITDNIDGTMTLAYTPNPKLETASFGLNWRTSRATISPTVNVDSNRNASAFVSVHFGAGADPYSHLYGIYNKYLAGTGGVAGRVFLDKNGSGVFDEGDELVPDVEMTALQSSQSANSDKDGIAFIPDLTENQLTDIVINPTTSQDAFAISMFEGVSIRPHPGNVVQLDFPIVDAGEIDGQAETVDAKGVHSAARNLKISLVAPNGKVEKTTATASDGYWSISSVRPGLYYLTAAADDTNAGYMVPRRIAFTPAGTVLFGQSVSLHAGPAIPFQFHSVNPPPDGPRHTRTIVAGDIERQETHLLLGHSQSRLGLTLAWYRFKLSNPHWNRDYTLLTPIQDIKPDPATGDLTIGLKPTLVLTMAEAAEACRGIAALHIDCTVDVVTRYYKTVPPPGKPFPSIAAISQAAKTNPAKPGASAVAKAGPAIQTIPAQPNTTPEEMLSDLHDYVSANPSIKPSTLEDKTVILNLGAYNSRVLMGVIWYKLKTHYPALIGDARLLAPPSDSFATTGENKFILRAALPNFDVDDAANRCKGLVAQGQACTVEVLPQGLKDLTASAASSKG